MPTRRFIRLPGLALAVLCTLLVGSVGAHDSKLEGTWNVTPPLRRPGLSSALHVVSLDVRCVLPVESSPDRYDGRSGMELEYAHDGDASSQSRQKNPAPRS